jgi:hypothetical protein
VWSRWPSRLPVGRPGSSGSEFSGAPPIYASDHMPHQRVQTIKHILKFCSRVYECSPTKIGVRPNRKGCSARQ